MNTIKTYKLTYFCSSPDSTNICSFTNEGYTSATEALAAIINIINLMKTDPHMCGYKKVVKYTISRVTENIVCKCVVDDEEI